jgi:hypothetical protein
LYNEGTNCGREFPAAALWKSRLILSVSLDPQAAPQKVIVPSENSQQGMMDRVKLPY